MRVWFPASVFAQFARAASAAVKSKKPIDPIRLTIVCAVLLSVVVVIGGVFFLPNLRQSYSGACGGKPISGMNGRPCAPLRVANGT